MKVLVLDVEAVVDADLVRSTYGVSPEERLAEVVARDPGEKMLPPWCYRPVVVVVATLAADGCVSRVSVIRADDVADELGDGPANVARRFWSGVERCGRDAGGRPDVRLVTYNGGRFDLPVLENEAWRSGYAAPGWFAFGAKSWVDPRSKYCTTHVDLSDAYSAFGRGGPRPPLRALATMVGAPERRDDGISGGDVGRLWAGTRGERDLVVGRCVCDVLDTWLVDLRLSRLAGFVDEDGERRARVSAGSVGDLLALAESFDDVRYWLEGAET